MDISCGGRQPSGVEGSSAGIVAIATAVGLVGLFHVSTELGAVAPSALIVSALVP